MDKTEVKKALEELKKNSKERKFKQRIELIVNLKGINLKKPEEQLEVFTALHYGTGKKLKLCAFVGPELAEDAKIAFDTVISAHDFDKLKGDKVKLKKIASEHSFFVAQANIMPQVAAVFGKVLGTRGKMPNPKAGCVVPPKTAMQPLYEKLQKTVVLKAKQQPSIKIPVGIEGQKEEELVDNIITAFDALIHKLPQELNNIKNVLLKTTMGKPTTIKHT